MGNNYDKDDKKIVHIVLVDDVEGARDGAAKFVEYFLARKLKQDCKIYHCVDGNEALEYLNDLKLRKLADRTLVITDDSMPGMSGAGLVDQMDKNEMLAKIPVLVMTGNASDWERSETLYPMLKSYDSPVLPVWLKKEVGYIQAADRGEKMVEDPGIKAVLDEEYKNYRRILGDAAAIIAAGKNKFIASLDSNPDAAAANCSSHIEPDEKQMDHLRATNGMPTRKKGSEVFHSKKFLTDAGHASIPRSHLNKISLQLPCGIEEEERLER